MNTDTTDIYLCLPYCGSIGHWAQLTSAANIKLEACDSYSRRTCRTRTTIMASNGPIDISVPVHAADDALYRDVRVNYNTTWNAQQKRALRSAYNSTPFFEFYADDFYAILDKHHNFLWDMNMEMMELIASLISVRLKYSLTEQYVAHPDGIDLRRGIEPKRQSIMTEGMKEVGYYQVFESKFGFVPDLSILDMLFNAGPETLLLLRQMQGK